MYMCVCVSKKKKKKKKSKQYIFPQEFKGKLVKILIF